MVSVTRYVTSRPAGFPVLPPGLHTHSFPPATSNTRLVVNAQSCFSDTKVVGSTQGSSWVLEENAALLRVNTWTFAW